MLTGVVLGMLFLNLLDLITPHLHKTTGLDAEEHRNVSDEMIPETHAHGFQKISTYSLILGFVTLLFLEMSF